jgi:hypothetical protein
MGIEKRFLKSSNEIFHKMFSFMQKWKILLKVEDVMFLEDKTMHLRS